MGLLSRSKMHLLTGPLAASSIVQTTQVPSPKAYQLGFSMQYNSNIT